MTKVRKTVLTLLMGLVMSIALCFGIVFSTPGAPTTVQAAETYTTKDVAMGARVAGWYGNGNFTMNITLGEADWGSQKGTITYQGVNDMPWVLRSMDFFNHIKLGDKTLAEWGCTTCYDNGVDLNAQEPSYMITLHLSMGRDNMTAASAAGIGGGTFATILEGAMIPSYAYLMGDQSATVYRAGCDYEMMSSGVAYGVKIIGKTDVQSVAYVTGWDSTYNNAYFGVSLRGDDYAAISAQTEFNRAKYQSSEFMGNHYSNKILVDGVGGKTEAYGLFNLGSKGQGYFSFVMRAQEAESEEIFIPAGTYFPSYAMNNMYDFNGNPVYMFYETQTDVTFYKQADGTWQKPLVEIETEVTDARLFGDSNDAFAGIAVAGSDYHSAPGTYGGTVQTARSYAESKNFTSHVLIDDQPLAGSGESYLNVWGNSGYFTFRPGNNNATKITVLAGCQLPTYRTLLTGEREVYVVKEDITFVKNAQGVWEKYIPEGDFDTSVTLLQYGRSSNVINVNLSESDYPAPNGNNASTYNIGVSAEKVLALNLFDNIIVDGYTLRSMYNNYGASRVGEDWMWINKFVGHNFAVHVPGEARTANKIVIRAGAQFPSLAYAKNGAEVFYVTTEEVTFIRTSSNVEANWEKQGKITFVADGETVATRTYTKANGIDGTVPAVPEKDGYKAVWESYTLTGDNIVVNAVYTAHDFTETKTNISKLEYAEGFLIVHLTNHDYPNDQGTIKVQDRVSSVHFFDFVEIDGKRVSSAPAAGGDAYLNIWNKIGSFASYLPAGTAAPASKVVIKKGAQIPTNAYRVDANNKTCFVVEEDVTFLNENGVWVRQGALEGATMPEYENNYILSDLYNAGHQLSSAFEKGYIYVDKATNMYGYNTSDSFSITFDMSLNLGSKDVSEQGNYTTLNVVTSTRGQNSSYCFGWRFFLYRPESENKCVQFFSHPSVYNDGENDGNIDVFEYRDNGTGFEKGKTYRVTLGYKLIDASNGTVEVYVDIDGNFTKRTYTLEGEYMNYAPYADSLVFTTTSLVANGIRISDPGMTEGEERHTLTLQDGDNVISSTSAWKYVLPELDAYTYNQTGSVFAGWTTDINNVSNLYPAGYEYTLTGDTTLYPVWIGFKMRDGAAVRSIGGSGLRFLVDIDGNAYSYGVSSGLIAGAGTLVVPTSYLSGGVDFVHASFPAGYFVDVPTDKWSSQKGDTWTYVAALVNISPAQYARSMSARGYLKLNYSNGETAYVYTPYDPSEHARSVYQVATLAYQANERPQSVIDYVNSVADITIDENLNIMQTAGTGGNYHLTIAREGEKVTLTVESGSVQALVINGTRILAGYAANVVVGTGVCIIDGYKMTTNGMTITFTLSAYDEQATIKYYTTVLESYLSRNDYTDLHKARVEEIVAEAKEAMMDGDIGGLVDYVATLESVKTSDELGEDVGSTKLATPVVSQGMGYFVTWEAVENADYYLVKDDNDYRDGVIVKADETLSYTVEVVGKHNVTVTAYSYYDQFKTSATSASFATVEVKPVFSYKAMYNGLYKFTKSQMNTLGISTSGNYYIDNQGTTSTSDDEYFVYYNKDTGWSANEANATDWTSPAEFPAHAARLKAMGNNILLISEGSAASLKDGDTWENSRLRFIMDTAWTLGMKVIVCDDIIYQQSKEVGSKSAAKTVINKRLELLKKYIAHPAFYGFSLEDEPEPNSLLTGSELESVGYMVQALKEVCSGLGYSKANGNEPFFLACLYQYAEGFELNVVKYDDYLEDWLSGTGLDYLYVDLYTGHAMGDNTNRYSMTYDVVYGSGTNGIVGSDKKFYQVITGHTQSKDKAGTLTEQDMYMSMLYAAAHNVAGYSWFCYFPIVTELAASMVGFDGNGYGNGIGNNASGSYYNAAQTAASQFEVIQSIFNGYKLKTTSYNDSKKLLTTTLSNGSKTITMYTNADTMSLSATPSVTASGSVCYLIGYGVGTAEQPYQVVSGSVTLQPGQAVICVG